MRDVSIPRRYKTVLGFVALAGCLTSSCQTQNAPGDPAGNDADAATRETTEWRAQHEASYRSEWSTIAGLHFLAPGSQTAGTAPTNDIVLPPSAGTARLGSFVLNGDTVRLEPAPGSAVQVNQQALTGARDLIDDGAPEPDRIEVGGIRMVVHRSGER
jgi:hypothetical protein